MDMEKTAKVVGDVIAQVRARKLMKTAKDTPEPGSAPPAGERTSDAEVDQDRPASAGEKGDDSAIKHKKVLESGEDGPKSTKKASALGLKLLAGIQKTQEKTAAVKKTPRVAKEAGETADIDLDSEVLAKIASTLLATDEGTEVVSQLLSKTAGAEAATRLMGEAASVKLAESRALGAQAAEADALKLAYEAGAASLLQPEAAVQPAIMNKVAEDAMASWLHKVANIEEPTAAEYSALGAAMCDELYKRADDTELRYFAQGRQDAAAALYQQHIQPNEEKIAAWAGALPGGQPSQADYETLSRVIGEDAVKVAQAMGMMPPGMGGGMPPEMGGGMLPGMGEAPAEAGGEELGELSPEELAMAIQELVSDGALDAEEAQQLLAHLESAGAVEGAAAEGADTTGADADAGDGAGEEADGGIESYASAKLAAAIKKVRAKQA